MKLIDRYVVLFAALMALYTIVFRFLLSAGLENERYILVLIYASTYAVVIAATGWALGRAHSNGNFRFDIGLPFSLAGFLAWTAVSYAWLGMGLASAQESLSHVHLGAAIWGVILALHIAMFFALRRGNTIRGIDRSRIFSE